VGASPDDVARLLQARVPRQPGDQQSRPGTENAQLRLMAVLYVQGQAHPRAVVPRDIAALHAKSVDGGCGAPPWSVGGHGRKRRAVIVEVPPLT
jgi:hypothetical protein